MTPEKVLKILNDISSGDPQVWVAGSAAICPQRADDVDIWILNGAKLKPKDFNKEVWEELPLLNEGYSWVLGGITARKQATLPSIYGSEEIKIQVMFTSWPDIYYGLKQFDASCHAWARGFDGRMAAASTATLPGKPIAIKSDIDTYYEEGCTCPNCQAQRFRKERAEEFTKRYADTSDLVLWLPS